VLIGLAIKPTKPSPGSQPTAGKASPQPSPAPPQAAKAQSQPGPAPPQVAKTPPQPSPAPPQIAKTPLQPGPAPPQVAKTPRQPGPAPPQIAKAQPQPSPIPTAGKPAARAPGVSTPEAEPKRSPFGKLPETAKATNPPARPQPLVPAPRTPLPTGPKSVAIPLQSRPSGVVQPPLPPPSAPPPVLADQFTIDVYSRINPILNESSFPVDDSVLGQLADGDLKAQVVFGGQVLPKGRFTLEWQLDSISPGPKPVLLNQVVGYNAEPTVGTYQLIFRIDKAVVKTFRFRISPARRSPVNKERLP